MRRSSIRGIRDTVGVPSALHVPQGGSLLVENMLIDGIPLAVGATPTGGITADRPASLVIRNSTLVGFTEDGIDVIADGATDLRMYNSIVHSCELGTLAGPPPALAYDYNMTAFDNCDIAGQGNPQSGVLIGPLNGIAGSFVQSRTPPFPSQAIDRGIPPGTPGDPLRQCTAVDQRNQPRPRDGDADGIARCDRGAIETTTLSSSTYVVNLLNQDLVDLLPGDDRCDAQPAAGDQCTLRAAVMEANAMTGGAIINIPGGFNIVLTQPEQAGPASAAHGDLDITSAITVRSQVGLPASRPTIQASHGTRIFNINAPSNIVRLENMRMTGGTTTGFGGAIRVESGNNVQIERIEAFANSADQGGGALAVMDGTVVVGRSDFHANGTAALGGAIYNQDDLSLSRSSVRGSLDLSPVSDREAVLLAGGGILGVLNSTVSGNVGDGIRVNDGTLQVENSTIVNHDRAGILFQRITGRTLFIHNSILSANGQSGCSTQGGGMPTISTDGYNLAPGNGCEIQNGASNLVAVNALLGPLSTSPNEHSLFHAPQFGSPVIDAGHPLVGGLGCIERDQLFNLRPVDGDGDGNGNARCDIGAVESPTLTEALFADGFE